MPAAGGRRIRSHALLRADRLAGLTADDWNTLAGLGITTICDLRSEAERLEHPNRVPAHLSVAELRCDISNDLRADPSLARLLVDEPNARGAERVMIEIYRRFPAYMGGTLATLIERLLEGGSPLLVHCSAGKDRTGFVIAMLLHALEVPEGLIRADYLASRTWAGADSHRASLEARLGTFIQPHELKAAVDTVLDVREVYFEAAMDSLRAEYGSVRRYLEMAAGVPAAHIDRLCNDLLE